MSLLYFWLESLWDRSESSFLSCITILIIETVFKAYNDTSIIFKFYIFWSLWIDYLFRKGLILLYLFSLKLTLTRNFLLIFVLNKLTCCVKQIEFQATNHIDFLYFNLKSYYILSLSLDLIHFQKFKSLTYSHHLFRAISIIACLKYIHNIMFHYVRVEQL